MYDQFESKIVNTCVAQKDKGGLRNSPAITFPHFVNVGRLELDAFARSCFIGQLDSPCFNQRFPGNRITWNPINTGTLK